MTDGMNSGDAMMRAERYPSNNRYQAPYSVGCQTARSEAEQRLPSWVHDVLDAARSGHDIYGNKLSAKEAQAVIGRWLRTP